VSNYASRLTTQFIMELHLRFAPQHQTIGDSLSHF